MKKKAFLLGICTLLSSALFVSCKPALQKGEVSSDSFTASMIANVRPLDELEVQAQVQGDFGILLQWSTVSRAGSYTVSRSEGADGGVWEVLASLSSDVTSYVDETAATGMEYRYKVEADCEYSNTDRFAYDVSQMPEVLSGDCSIYTGVSAAYWSEDISEKEQITLGSIKLEYYFGSSDKEGMEPEGIEIYRGTSKGSYRLLKRATVADFSGNYDLGKNYIDKTVEQGRTYYYQVRAYAVLDGKRVYGKKSTPLKLTAAEPEGKYSIRVVREPGSYSHNMIVALTSTAKGNGTLTLSAATLQKKVCYLYRKTQEAYEAELEADTSSQKEKADSGKAPVQTYGMKVSRISSDGRYYSSDIQDIVLEPQKTIYLELEPTDSTQELFSSLTLSRAELYIPARYNEGKHTMKFNLKKGKAELLDTSVYKKYSGKGK